MKNKPFFFIDDREKIAKWVAANCPDAVREIIAVANDVAQKKFLFNLRWDMERTYTPVSFDGAIDWMHQPGDDPEWVFAFNRMRFWICLGQAYAITKDELYAKAFADQLVSWINTVRRDDPMCAKAWRTIEAGIRMEYWCKAMAYFDSSASVTKAVRDAFEASMTEHAEFIMGVWNSYNLMSNWGVLANHGLFVASVMLPQSAQTRVWQAEAITRLAKEINIQVYADGTQWEQSPMYHNEVAHDFLDVIILARRNGISLPECIERTTRDMCYANVWWVKPDGNEPCMGDSDDIDARDIISKGAYLFRDGTLKSLGYETLDFDCAWDLGYRAIAEYEKIKPVPPMGRVHALEDSGNYYWRSNWNVDATYLHFHCGTLGAGHGHSDQLHVDLYANGEDILVDSGRFTYVAKNERYEFKDSTAHNTTTVDEKNFYACKDSWECSKLSRAVNRTCVERNGYAMFEGGHLGYYDHDTGSVFANRRVIVLAPDLFVIADEFYASANHTYQSYLHFNNAGHVSRQYEDSWRYTSGKNTVYIGFTSASNHLAQTVIPTRMSRHYNLAVENSTLKTSFEDTGFASLFTVISLGAPSSIERMPVRSNFKNIEFEKKQIEALSVTQGNKKFTVVVAHQEYASPTDTFLADGCTGFGQVVVFDRSAGETETGTVLQW